MNYTMQQLINHYRDDPKSSFAKLQYQVRVKHERLLARIEREHGSHELNSIRAPTLIWWHQQWASGGKFAMARSLFGRLRVLFRFGGTIRENEECRRLCFELEEIRLPQSSSRSEPMTLEHARAICATAHINFGWHAISLAQALVFECNLQQKEVIGEWVPETEPGEALYRYGKAKWVSGLIWQEIDDNLILRHKTSKKQKMLVEIDLKLLPMVMEELQRMVGKEQLIVVSEITKKVTVNRQLLPATGPVCYCDTNGLPWSPAEFRRKRALVAKEAGVPNTSKNRNSSLHEGA